MKLQVPYGKISGYKVGKILKHFVIDIEAVKTAELMNLNRHTVEDYYNLFRELIYQHQMACFRKLAGVIEADESYFGPRRIRGKHIRLKRGRGTRKQPVFGIYERGGRVYTEIIPNCCKATLKAIIEHTVAINSEMNTDGWPGITASERPASRYFLKSASGVTIEAMKNWRQSLKSCSTTTLRNRKGSLATRFF